MTQSVCKHCQQPIYYSLLVEKWSHFVADSHVAEPVAESQASHSTGVEPEYLDATNHGSDVTVEKLLDIVANGQTGKFGGEKLQQLADWIVEHRATPAPAQGTPEPPKESILNYREFQEPPKDE